MVVTPTIVVMGAGCDDANGVYMPTGRNWYDAPIFENDRRCLLSREPHHNSKTGESSYGWILGQDRQPLYAVRTSDLVPCPDGWKIFAGGIPLPKISVVSDAEKASLTAAQGWKDAGNKHFSEGRYANADAIWTRAINLSHLADENLHVTLYANRAEARIRQKLWDAALSDANAALEKQPNHEKALLRAATVTMELMSFSQAHEYAHRALKVNPRNLEAQDLLSELSLKISKTRKLYCESSLTLVKHRDGERQLAKFEQANKTARMNQKMLTGLQGYSDVRSKEDEPPPVSALPYHRMGLPQDQVDKMDNFLEEQRAKKKDDERRKRDRKEDYDRVKNEYRQRTLEDIADGKMQPVKEIFGKGQGNVEGQEGLVHWEDSESTVALLPKTRTAAPKKTPSAWALRLTPARPVERVELSPLEKAEIDALFEGYEQVESREPAVFSLPVDDDQRLINESKKRVANAKAMVKLNLGHQVDVKEQDKIYQHLFALKIMCKGEPTNFEQTPTEIHGWWKLPPGIEESEIALLVSSYGSALTLVVRDVVIFDGQLFGPIDDTSLTHSLEDDEIYISARKGEKYRHWLQLGFGHPPTEQITYVDERLEGFEQLLGSDNLDQNSLYVNLSEEHQQIVKLLRRLQHSYITMDEQEMTAARDDVLAWVRTDGN